MKVWIAKDWTGTWIFQDKPHLGECPGGMPKTFSGHKLKCFDVQNSFYSDELRMNECLEVNIGWTIFRIVK